LEVSRIAGGEVGDSLIYLVNSDLMQEAALPHVDFAKWHYDIWMLEVFDQQPKRLVR
jgi:hypothetical protein